MTEVKAGERAAGIVSRGVAAVLDLLVVLIVLGVLYLGWALMLLAFSPRAFSFPSISTVFSALGMAVVATLYLAACWLVSGCTAGAVVMGLRVVSRGGARLKTMIALLRALACVLFPLGLAWVAVDKQRRSVQDILLSTRVVYDRRATVNVP